MANYKCQGFHTISHRMRNEFCCLIGSTYNLKSRYDYDNMSNKWVLWGKQEISWFGANTIIYLKANIVHRRANAFLSFSQPLIYVFMHTNLGLYLVDQHNSDFSEIISQIKHFILNPTYINIIIHAQTYWVTGPISSDIYFDLTSLFDFGLELNLIWHTKIGWSYPFASRQSFIDNIILRLRKKVNILKYP